MSANEGRETDDYADIRRSVREFVEAEVKPIANDLDRQNKEIPERFSSRWPSSATSA